MNIIPQSEIKRKRVKLVRGGLGYVIKGQHDHWYGVSLPKRSRGDISRFSAASARRLRETLALARYKGCASSRWGFCFTIPGRILKPGEVRQLWHDWVVEFNRSFASAAMIWRIELQQRKQAHWHAVLFLPRDTAAILVIEIGEAWRRLVRSRVGSLSRRTDAGFDLYGVNTRCLDGASATGIIGYIADHTSKHKREQLGWIGRQWGVVNRSLLDFDGEVVAEFDDDVHKRAARQFRRLQERLRRDPDALYTGGGVTPSGNVQRSVFGRDADRLLKCYRNESKKGAS